MCVYGYRKDIPGRFMQQNIDRRYQSRPDDPLRLEPRLYLSMYGIVLLFWLQNTNNTERAMAQDCCKEHHMACGLNGTGKSYQPMCVLL